MLFGTDRENETNGIKTDRRIGKVNRDRAA